MASPPFNIAETVPADSDIVSQFPGVERTFRDVVESWLLVEHNTSGYHDQLTLANSSGSVPGGVASHLTLWNDSGNLYIRDGTGTARFLLDVSALTIADSVFLVGDGTKFVEESGATARTSLGLTIGTNVQAFDAFLQDIADLTDPGADRILFWDDSASDITWLTVGNGLDLTGVTLTVDSSDFVEDFFYTGSSSTNVTFPIGSYLLFEDTAESGYDVNESVGTIRTKPSDRRYGATDAVGGSVITGTWRARGWIGTHIYLIQRTA